MKRVQGPLANVSRGIGRFTGGQTQLILASKLQYGIRRVAQAVPIVLVQVGRKWVSPTLWTTSRPTGVRRSGRGRLAGPGGRPWCQVQVRRRGADGPPRVAAVRRPPVRGAAVAYVGWPIRCGREGLVGRTYAIDRCRWHRIAGCADHGKGDDGVVPCGAGHAHGDGRVAGHPWSNPRTRGRRRPPAGLRPLG